MKKAAFSLLLSAAVLVCGCSKERPHVFSLTCKATSLNGDLASPGKRAAFVRWAKGVGIGKLWLEGWRYGESVKTAALEQMRDSFRADGFAVSGMITPTRFNDAPKGETAPVAVCWSDPKAKERFKNEMKRLAKIFDEIIVDDFLFSSCGDDCRSCREDKGRQGFADWAVYRRALMHGVAEDCAVSAAKSVNPLCRVIVKFPCRDRDWRVRGYDFIETAGLFDAVAMGIESRDADPDNLHGYALMRLGNAAFGEKCIGGWFDPLDASKGRFLEQARFNILAGARESIVHCYDYLLAENPGETPFG